MGVMALNTQNLTVSAILKSKSSCEDEPLKKSREDWRKAKELEEARKAGTAPAAVDETGKDINPHIPQYISTAPWYYGTSGPTLKHQRPQAERQQEYSDIDEWYKRGIDASKVVTKYRKGACENCGALTHKKKECMERPRKIGAKYSGANIAADEFVQKKLSLSYDGKRDRWSGYNPSEHKTIVEEFQKVEEAKRHLRAEKLNAGDEDEDDNNDEDKYVDEVDMPGTKVDSKQRITVRNLRIREDTAKYLRNLDPNSAYYDPKTRSMREHPNPEREHTYAGENFVRFSGDTTQHAKAQVFAWDAHEKGVDVHLLAEPTKLELLQKEYEKKKDQFESNVQSDILEKYGGEEYLDAPPKSLLLAQTEDYVEYSRSGKLIKGQERNVILSKYDEDVYFNNHITIWGSFWKDGQWGYKCCKAFIKNSYCVRDSDSKEANEDFITRIPSSNESNFEAVTTGTERTDKKIKKQDCQDEDTLQLALNREEEHNRKVEDLMKLDERKRPYNSMYDAKKPTEKEIEAYYLKRKREEDPINYF